MLLIMINGCDHYRRNFLNFLPFLKICGPNLNPMQRHVTFLGVASSWGAAYRGPEQAPVALWVSDLATSMVRPHFTVDWHGILEPMDPAPAYDMKLDQAYSHIVEISYSTAREIGEILAAQPLTMPIVFGGDHSIAIGTWSGVITSLQAFGQFGLLWIDAHMDAHTPVTSVQGKWGGHFHGMPLAHLLGHGDKDLCEIGSKRAKLKGKHVALVGVRSFEPGEQQMLADMGATVFMMEDIKRDGLEAVMKKALDIVTAAPKGWGISLDLDAFDPVDMPGVGTPEPNGIFTSHFLQCWSALKIQTLPKAVEIVEYIPDKDPNFQGVSLIEKFLWLLLKK
jgi:arginase